MDSRPNRSAISAERADKHEESRQHKPQLVLRNTSRQDCRELPTNQNRRNRYSDEIPWYLRALLRTYAQMGDRGGNLRSGDDQMRIPSGDPDGYSPQHLLDRAEF